MRFANFIPALVCLAASSGHSLAQDSPDRQLTVEQLLTDGWEVAGYIGTLDNRSSLMLFKHKDKHYLVQCSVLYDVTRYKRTQVHCYEVR